MSYDKMRKWNRQRPKGTKQPVIMHTNSGFWPSGAFIELWAEYAKECEAKGEPYLSCKDYYYSQLRR